MTSIAPLENQRRWAAPSRTVVFAHLYDELERNIFPVDRELRAVRFGALRAAGAAALGAFAGALSIFLIFIILNLIFHYQP